MTDCHFSHRFGLLPDKTMDLSASSRSTEVSEKMTAKQGSCSLTPDEYLVMADNADSVSPTQEFLPGNWQELSRAVVSSDLRAVAFFRGAQIAVSFATTDMTINGDFLTKFDKDCLIANWQYQQLKAAAAYYLRLQDTHPDCSFSFAGQGQGGSVAVLLAAFFNVPALAFTPAGIHQNLKHEVSLWLLNDMEASGFVGGTAMAELRVLVNDFNAQLRLRNTSLADAGELKILVAKIGGAVTTANEKFL